jgi:hypothetical protein
MFLSIFFAVFAALCVWKLLEGIAELPLSKYNPFVYLAASIMYPFIWLSERHLPQKERTPFF